MVLTIIIFPDSWTISVQTVSVLQTCSSESNAEES